MTPGLILNALAFAAAGGNIALHYPKIAGNRASLKPRREQAVMVLALLLAVAGFFLHPGIVGITLGVVAIIPAGLFLLGSSTSGLAFRRHRARLHRPGLGGTSGSALELSRLAGAAEILSWRLVSLLRR